MSEQQVNFDSKDVETKAKMIRGSIWMSASSIVSRLMGAIYIIPWYALMGENANAANSLFNKGYNIYALFLMISTAGIPAAVAKQISHYNSLNEYGISKKLFKRTLALMTGLGVFFAGFMYFAAPILAAGTTELIPVMRALSLAVLIFPVMSVIRGFFQGYHDMMPSAVSQIVEQFARVFYMLLATFIIIKMRDGNYAQAVTQSTFAAFIGVMAALGTLLWNYHKQSPRMKVLEENSNNTLEITMNDLIKEMIIEAVPFIIVGSGITLFKLVDQYTFERMMRGFTNYSDRQLTDLFSIFSANPDKLTMITVSLATSLSVTSLPLITEAFTLNNHKGLARQVSDNLQLFFFVMIPSTIGMIVLAQPLYTFFYTPDLLGTSVLIQACYLGLILGLFMLVSMILQGLYENKQAMLYLGYGFLTKIILQYPMIRWLEVYGPLVATGIGFMVTCYFTLRSIRKITRFNVSLTARRTLLITIFSVAMLVATLIARKFLYLFLSPTSKMQSLVIILLVAVVGIAVYGYLVLKVRLADKLLGQKVSGIRRRLKIK